MNYYDIIKNDVNNGSNFRVSLFVTGCCFNCKGCWNKELQNPKCGQKFTEETKQELFNEVSKPYYEGISILGGDPLMPYNIKEITELLKEFKEKMYNFCDKVCRALGHKIGIEFSKNYDIDYDKIHNLASEAKQKLKSIQPTSIGQALRISGVNPADISLIMVYLKKEYHHES